MAGQLRTYKKCYGCLKENVLDPLNPDIFIHTENRTGITKRASSTALDDVQDETVKRETLESFYDPIDLKITEPFSSEDLREFKGVRVPEKLIQAEPDHWKGNLPNFYGIYKCNEMKRHWEEENGFKYDIVIRMRPDLLIPNQIPSKVLSNPNTLWHTQSTEYQISDKMAVSSSENMDYYSLVWKKLPQYWDNPLDDGEWVNHRVGERLLKHHMRESSIETQQFDIGSYHLRSRSYFKNKLRKEMKSRNRLADKINKGFKNPSKAARYLFKIIIKM
jgi:hypothetical protein